MEHTLLTDIEVKKDKIKEISLILKEFYENAEITTNNFIEFEEYYLNWYNFEKFLFLSFKYLEDQNIIFRDEFDVKYGYTIIDENLYFLDIYEKYERGDKIIN